MVTTLFDVESDDGGHINYGIVQYLSTMVYREFVWWRVAIVFFGWYGMVRFGICHTFRL